MIPVLASNKTLEIGKVEFRKKFCRWFTVQYQSATKDPIKKIAPKEKWNVFLHNNGISTKVKKGIAVCSPCYLQKQQHILANKILPAFDSAEGKFLDALDLDFVSLQQEVFLLAGSPVGNSTNGKIKLHLMETEMVWG